MAELDDEEPDDIEDLGSPPEGEEDDEPAMQEEEGEDSVPARSGCARGATDDEDDEDGDGLRELLQELDLE